MRRVIHPDSPRDRVIAGVFCAVVTGLIVVAVPWMTGFDELFDRYFPFSDTQHIWAPIVIVAAGALGAWAGLDRMWIFWEGFFGLEKESS